MSSTLVSATLISSVSYDYQNTDSLGVTTDDQPSSPIRSVTSLTSGTGAAGTADLKYSALYSIAGGATQDIDLAGSLLDRFGATLTFARIKEIYIQVLGTADDAASTGGPVHVGGAVSNQFVNWIDTATAKIKVGGTAGRGACFHLSCDDAVAYAVTAGTGDILRLTNDHGSNTVKVRVVLIGSST